MLHVKSQVEIPHSAAKLFDSVQVNTFNPHTFDLRLMSTIFNILCPYVSLFFRAVCFSIPSVSPCWRLQVGLHGKAAAEALQSGAERVRRELQAAGGRF